MNTINNDHNVYILGAGFSIDRGLPIISNFMDYMRNAHEWLEAKNRSREANAITEVLEFRLNAASAAYRVKIDLDNIEELFSLASAVDRDLSATIQLAIAATIDYCVSINPEPLAAFNAEKDISWPSAWRFDSTSSRIRAPLYEFYVNACIGGLNEIRNPKARNTFLTFNYDCLIEQALGALNVPFSYGFKPNSVTFDDSFIKTFPHHGPNELKVLKLHGSVNWAYPRRQGQKLTIFGSYSDIANKNLTPELTPPTWRKTFDGKLINIWDQAIQELASASRIIIVGFSMPQTDMHFKYLLAAGLEKNISLRKIVFVNPDRLGISERCNSIFGEMMRASNKLEIVETNVAGFISQGLGINKIADYGRDLHHSIQHVYKEM